MNLLCKGQAKRPVLHLNLQGLTSLQVSEPNPKVPVCNAPMKPEEQLLLPSVCIFCSSGEQKLLSRGRFYDCS